MERRCVEVRPEADLLPAIRDDGMSIARDTTRAVPLASMYQRASTRRPAAVEQPVTRSPSCPRVTRSQTNVVPSALGVFEQAGVERCPIDVQSHGLEAQRRSPDQRWRRGHPCLSATLVDDDVLLVGRDLVSEQRSDVNADASEQAGTRPVERFADLAMRVHLPVQAYDAQARLAQAHARRQPGDAGADDRHVIVSCERHAPTR